MISEKERSRIGQYIYKEILDVEGFKNDDITTHKYVQIVAFLSNNLIVLNKGDRSEEIINIVKIIEKGLIEMQKKNIPRILKVIYIQTIYKDEKIEDFLKSFDYDKNIFKGIEFKYFYLPNIPPEIKKKKRIFGN